MGQRENQIVLFGGTSAGGRGSMVGFNWTRWLSYFLFAQIKGGCLYTNLLDSFWEESMFLDMVTIYNYNGIQV